MNCTEKKNDHYTGKGRAEEDADGPRRQRWNVIEVAFDDGPDVVVLVARGQAEDRERTIAAGALTVRTRTERLHRPSLPYSFEVL